MYRENYCYEIGVVVPLPEHVLATSRASRECRKPYSDRPSCLPDGRECGSPSAPRLLRWHVSRDSMGLKYAGKSARLSLARNIIIDEY
jgi:hypothetical protein